MPASPSLGGVIESLTSRFDELLVEVRVLEDDDNRLSQEIRRETRRRDTLLAQAAAPALEDSAKRHAKDEVEAVDERIAALRIELAEVRTRLSGAETERDRVQQELADLEEAHASIADMLNLHFERAEFERRRYEASEALVRSLRAQVLDLQSQMQQQAEELVELRASAQSAQPVDDQKGR